MNESDVRIGEVVNELVITEGIGPLSPQEVKALVAVVLEQLRHQQDLRAERDRDTAMRDRAFRSGVV